MKQNRKITHVIHAFLIRYWPRHEDGAKISFQLEQNLYLWQANHGYHNKNQSNHKGKEQIGDYQIFPFQVLSADF